ncbi:uncharacterized protein LOC144696013 [Cetorhinus maximus]
MAPASQSLAIASGLLYFPQLFLAVSIVFLLLLILLVNACISCWSLPERIRKGIRSREGQHKAVSMKEGNVPVQPKDELKLTNANEVIPTIIDQQTGNVDKISLQPIPSIPLTSLAQIEESNDDSLYEVVRDIQLDAWQPEQACPGPQSLKYMTPCKEMSSTDPRQIDGCGNENMDPVEGQTPASIYAKIVKPRNREYQSLVQEKLEAKNEVEEEKPPPVPDKHLD